MKNNIQKKAVKNGFFLWLIRIIHIKNLYQIYLCEFMYMYYTINKETSNHKNIK